MEKQIQVIDTFVLNILQQWVTGNKQTLKNWTRVAYVINAGDMADVCHNKHDT